jgi:hypothetical protein
VEVFLPALLAGVAAIAITLAIEKWGGRVGGLLGTVPSTIVPAAIGIWNQSENVEAFKNAMDGVPPGMFLSAGFLWIWKIVPPRLGWANNHARLLVTASFSLLAWGFGALVLVRSVSFFGGTRELNEGVGRLGFVALVALGLLGSRRRPGAPRGAHRASILMLMLRGAAAAAAIAVAVIISARGGDVAAGVAAVFPAIFLTTMVSLWLAQGEAVPVGAVGPMMLGSSSVAAFALIAGFTFPAWGELWGALFAWIFSVSAITLPAHLWLARRTEKPDPRPRARRK